jgi:hypothetical protein
MRDGRALENSHSPSHSFSNGHSPSFVKPAVNGHATAVQDTNGSSHVHSNGVTSKRALPQSWMGHERQEVTRILIQSLNDLGYTTSANALSLESGFELEIDSVAHFRNAMLAGKWDDAEFLLFGDLFRDSGGTTTTNGSAQTKPRKARGLGLVPGVDEREMLFWIRQQKYLELLEKGDINSALVVLRQELTPLHQDTDRLHILGG